MATSPSERSMRDTLFMLLGSIGYISAMISFEAPLVVKLTQFFAITDSDLGLLLALTTAIMAVVGLPWGYAADKFPRNRLLCLSLAITTLSMFSSALCLYMRLPYAVYFALKLLAGFGLAGVSPIAMSAVMDTVPAPKRAVAMGWVGVAFAVGAGAGMFLGSICMRLGLSLGFAYLLGALLGLGFCLWPLAVSEPRRGCQDEALQAALATGAAEYAHSITPRDIKVILSKPFNLWMFLITVFIQFPIQMISIWLVTSLMRQHGLNELNATLLMTIVCIGQPFGYILGGAWADRAYRRRRTGRLRVMIACGILAPVIFLAGILTPFHWWIYVPLVFIANCFIAAVSPPASAIGLEVNLPEHRGTYTALGFLVTNGARAAAWWLPPLIAVAYGGNYTMAFVYMAVLYVPFIALCAFMLRRIEPALEQVRAILAARAESMGKPENTSTPEA